jgi:hypothetical protein
MFKNQVFLDFAKAAGKQRQRLEKCKLFSPNLERNWQVGEKIGEKRTRTARNAHPSGVGKTDEVICNESEHRL